MSIAFPAGGSLYYTEDLKNAVGSTSWSTRPGITLEDNRFCVGPDTSVRLWYGRRSQLDLDRGPCRPLLALFGCSLKLTDNYRRECRSSPRKRGRKGTSFFTAVWSTAVAVPALQEGNLQVSEAAAVRSHRESEPLSPHRVVPHPQKPGPRSFPHPPSRPPAEQYLRFQVARL